MSRPVAVIGLAVVIVGLVVGPVTAVHGIEATPLEERPSTVAKQHGVAVQPAITDDRQSLFQRTAGSFDRTAFVIRVFENGSARWTFRYTRLLDNGTERSTFEAYAADFRANETVLYRQFLEQAEALASSGRNLTGRPMNATAFNRDAFVRPLGTTGIVEMAFTWTHFGEQRESGSVLVSDVFEGGLYIRDDQRLAFVAGPQLAFERVDPAPDTTSGETLVDSERIAWVGEQSFASRHPTVVFQPAGAVETSTSVDGNPRDDSTTTRESADNTAAAGDGTGPTTTAGASGSPGIGLTVSLIALGLVALGIGAAAWLNGYFEPGDRGDSASETDTGEATGGAVQPEQSDEPTLLSDEDRVTQLLEDNGGRMKQSQIVDATEWSKSKVSMLLSEMAEDDEVTKLRVGRENIISLPGNEPDAARSPFEADDK